MSINPIGAVSSVQQHTAPAAVKVDRPHDGDGDAGDGGRAAGAAKAVVAKPGSVDLKA